MKSKQPAPKVIVPFTVTYTNGKKHIAMKISGTKLEDWVDKSVILTSLKFSDKTLRTLRETKKIPAGKLGGMYFYYLPGILTILEQSLLS